MSWNPMETAPKDGTVIVVYYEYRGKGPKPEWTDVRQAFYDEAEGTWDSLEDKQDHRFSQLATLTGWIEVPNSSPIAGKTAYRDGDLAREPGKLHVRG